ncbi:MAG: hypothetical protein CMJ90_04100, partial [Planctomycetes bacterium]|nr:hypothetical protein [Planctomycetota bacterium]
MDDYTSDSDCKTSSAQSNGLQFGDQLEQDRQEIAQLQIDLDAYRSQWEIQQHVVIERHLSLLETLQRQVVELESQSHSSDSDQVVASSSGRESHTRQFKVLEQRLEQAAQLSDQQEKTITSLCSEIEQLKTEKTSPSEAIDESVNDHPWQRRYELALEDLQELRQHNQTLTEKLEQAAVTAGTQSSDTSDWESMKQRLLSELENGDASTQHSPEEQTSLTNSMEIMDQIVLEKDDEIRELQRILS